MKKVVALVPMKANSVRVPNKNARDLDGSPLFYHILRTLQKCNKISAIYVDTDSDVIKEKIRADFKDVKVIDRPERLRGGSVPMNSVIEYDLSQVEGDYFLQTHSTNPLLKPETIDRAVEFFLSHPEYDSLFSVTKVLKRFYDSKGNAVNHDVDVMLNTQDLDPLFEENACIFLFSRQSFSLKKNRLGQNPCMFEISNREEAMDIDEEFDFELVKMVMGRRK